MHWPVLLVFPMGIGQRLSEDFTGKLLHSLWSVLDNVQHFDMLRNALSIVTICRTQDKTKNKKTVLTDLKRKIN